VFIELKKPAVPLKSAFDDNLRDYRGQSVPQLFHPNAFILLSNGSDTKVGTLTSDWEHFFEWKRVDDEARPARSAWSGTSRPAGAGAAAGLRGELHSSSRRARAA
jgi:type I site-specific restriction-modification system R (restriction) subunit